MKGILQRNRAIYFHVHLVSDSTGETLVTMSRASCAQFPQGKPIEHLHALVRSQTQLEKVLGQIKDLPGVIFHTLVNHERRLYLEQKCAEMNMPAGLNPRPCFGEFRAVSRRSHE